MSVRKVIGSNPVWDSIFFLCPIHVHAFDIMNMTALSISKVFIQEKLCDCSRKILDISLS